MRTYEAKFFGKKERFTIKTSLPVRPGDAYRYAGKPVVIVGLLRRAKKAAKRRG